MLDLDKKEILFLLGYFCLKWSNSIRSLVYSLILSSIWNISDSPFVYGKEVQFFLVLDMLADSSLLYKYSAIAANLRVLCALSCFWFFWYLWVAIWNSERGLLPLGFGSAVWLFALSWCIATFGFNLWLSFWFVYNSYLVFGILEFCVYFSFGLIFFVPIICLEIFFKPKIFS